MGLAGIRSQIAGRSRAIGALAVLLCLQAGAATLDRETPDPLAPAGVWAQRSFGDASLPPMGWNSWNAFKTHLSEDKVIGSAQAIVATGLRDLGYRYINLDDGWWQKRRQPDGAMVVRTSIFPSARGNSPEETSFRPFVAKIHAMGLKAGIYTDIGRNACSQGYPDDDSLLPTGSLAEREVGIHGHLEQDLSLYFQDWGFDYIKVDGCGLNAFAPDKPEVKSGKFRAFPALVASDEINLSQVGKIRDLYGELRDTLVRIRPGGDFVFSICNWGTANVRAWGRDLGNLWRTSDDIEPRWSRMLYNFDSVATRELYSGPGHWNDPDMLFIGHGDFDAGHLAEARTHFALWAIADAPLIIGYDLRDAPRTLLDIWGAAEIIAVNQDREGNQGVLAYTSDDLQIIVKQLSRREEKAVVLFNRGVSAVEARLTAAHLKFSPTAPIEVRDLWERRDLGAFTGEKVFRLAPRESVMLRVQGKPELEGGMYLSEMPARMYVAVDGIRALQPDPHIHRMVAMGDESTRGTGSRAVLAGWGAPRADSTPYDNEIRIRTRPYASGIGALAESRLQVRTDRNFTRFTAEVGMDDSSLERSTKLRFEVYGDGRLLAKSPDLDYSSAAFALTADVAGVKVVELVAREIGTGRAPTVVAWGRPALFQ